MLSNVLRDAELVDFARDAVAPLHAYLEEAAEVLTVGRPVRGRRRQLLAGALRHALAFSTWRSLSANGIGRSDAVKLMHRARRRRGERLDALTDGARPSGRPVHDLHQPPHRAARVTAAPHVAADGDARRAGGHRVRQAGQVRLAVARDLAAGEQHRTPQPTASATALGGVGIDVLTACAPSSAAARAAPAMRSGRTGPGTPPTSRGRISHTYGRPARSAAAATRAAAASSASSPGVPGSISVSTASARSRTASSTA